VDFTQQNDRILLEGLPDEPFDDLFPVVALELDGEPRGVPNPLSEAGHYD
jgi:hypothetical protein